MVFIHVKHSVQHQFLLACSCSCTLQEATHLAALVHNARLRLMALLQHAAGLVASSSPGLSVQCLEALQLVSLAQPASKRTVNLQDIELQLESLTKLIEGEIPAADAPDAVDAEGAGLWLIGRLRPAEDLLSAHIGTNEKTTVSAVLATLPLQPSEERKAVKQDPELESQLHAREQELKELFQAHAGTEVEEQQERPLKLQKTEAAPQVPLSEGMYNLPELAEEQAARLIDCKYVRDTVKSAQLQQVIAEILVSEHPRAALDAVMNCDAHFKQFVLQMISEVLHSCK